MDNTIYKKRRINLSEQLPKNSALLIPGADIQYRNADSAFAFRQDSNFYCVGNSLSHSFFEWYLKTYYNFKSLERETYSVVIIDSNVNEHTMNSNNCLVLDKKTFKIQ